MVDVASSPKSAMRRGNATRQSPMSLSDLARLRGCSPQAVSKLARPGGRLAAARLPDGSIDATHPAVRAWLRQEPPTVGVARPAAPAVHPLAADAADEEPAPDELDETDAELANLARDVAGSRAAKLAAEARLAERRDATHAGRLIAREPVRAHVFGLLDQLFRRLLSDTATTIASRVRAASTLEEGRALVIDVIGSQLARTKHEAVRAIRAARTGDSPPEVRDAEGLAAAPRVCSDRLKVALLECMRGPAAAGAIDACAKGIARAAAGRPWTAEVFADAMALRAELAAELEPAVGAILAAHVEAVIRRAQIEAGAHDAEHEEGEESP